MERQLERKRDVERGERGGGKLTSKKIMKFFFVAWAAISQRQQVHVRQQVGIVNGIGDEIGNGNRNVCVMVCVCVGVEGVDGGALCLCSCGSPNSFHLVINHCQCRQPACLLSMRFVGFKRGF